MEKLLIYLSAFTIGFNFPIITIFISTFFIGALIAQIQKKRNFMSNINVN